jgi:homocysteine S-methyltransferase
VAEYGIPIVAGVWPLASFKNAEFMNNEVPGIEVPVATLERMREAGNGDRARAVGIEIALENVAAIRHAIAGIQVSAPLGKISIALEVISRIHGTG